MEKRFKVVRVGGIFSQLAAVEETEELAKVNAELVEAKGVTEDDVIEAAKDADAILSMDAEMTRRIMEAVPKCRLICNYGVGYDSVDVDAATDNNIIVTNTPSPEWCVEEVTNHTMALLLACAKKLVFQNNATKQGRWIEWGSLTPMVPIYGQTLGVIGCGNIGRMTARKAQCFSLKVLGYDPYVDKTLAREHGITMVVSLSELLKESDFVTAHPLLTKETRHMMGEREFKQMKPTAYFINTARGAVVDEPALIKALQEKWIAGAGLDVFEKEPIDSDNPLLKMDNVVVMPHAASCSDVSIKWMKLMVGQEAARVLTGRWPKNVVNPSVKPKVDLVKELY